MKDCVSLDIANKLKEAGWEQGGQFCYSKDFIPKDWSMDGTWELKSSEGVVFDCIVRAAPTIGELLEALPKNKEIKLLWDEVWKHWSCDFGQTAYVWHKENCQEPADALALLWLALKEKKLV